MTVLMTVLYVVLVFVGVWCLFGVWTWWERERFWRRLR
jgi:hypothetical protein